ncbi:putative Cytochrome c assembly protein; putative TRANSMEMBRANE PROTEIN [Cupriavidus taiwanensis]|uniref:Cytochrome c assembly protein putative TRANSMEMBRANE PROTEIN n=1 Tax=Cupriavidus taiwanensis TaxID=164546 RepID=A0A375E2A8_9BURK|nr:cytochrome c biogenesis protein CcsA [Cupriavidus taiwanensis]SOZ56767.1 putative Cytochrome c assembly protein; putative TRANSMEMBRANE PROTEIN [Cupriavidus taiwanensis]SOZ57389.1 putative Cytochrome c assembly protein; putative TRANSMEMBRANE PROTEIN [Cupriavidus taiwanensis]SOZ60630.1 putative Cytochrome c assembly protein; putative TRANSMEMBRANE PROTEIN [Cupriavidus taiwanensis]SPA05855.1 putative Cytochrome c assembly protein; putative TRANSMEMBRANE PROTEIN [Cupriavidus taiwanensis]
MVIVLYALTALLYCGLAWHGWATRHPRVAASAGPAGASAAAVLVAGGGGIPPAGGAHGEGRPAWWHLLMLAALACHGMLLHETIFPAERMMFGFAFALSAMLWLGVGIYWIESFFFSLAGLGLIVIPVALVASLMPLAFPGSQILGYAARPLFKLHFIIANVAYGLFTLAAFHAFLMLLAERRLHGFRHAPARMTQQQPGQWLGRWLDLLPPLLTLEKLLFRLIGAGFVLLTLTIGSGLLFSEELFGRAFRLDHKTVFALISWAMFGGILAGRVFRGWRGKVALRWVIASFGILLLAYVGSRFVIEVVLHRL